jgi:hypothetical protein
MYGYIIISILLILLGWVLLAPVYLMISTAEKRYEAGLKGLFRLNLVAVPDGLAEIHIRVFFLKFQYPLFLFKEKKRRKKGDDQPGKKQEKRFSVTRILFVFRIFRKVFRSFRLKKLYLNIDTGDVIRNARLYPVFAMNWKQKIRLSVNFERQNELVFHIENSVISILIQIIKTYINQRKK